MKLGKFTARIFICVCISLLAVCVLIICASAAFAQERGPLSVAEIETLLKGDSSPKRVEQHVNERGVNFELSASVRARLRNAGAEASVLKAIEKASAAYVARRPAVQPSKTTDPERGRLEEENRKLSDTLQQAEAKKKEEAERVKLEEENRKLREALKRAEASKIAPAPPLSPTSRALSVAGIEHLLQERMSSIRLAQLVDQYGVNSTNSKAIEERLQKAGADGTVLVAVGKAAEKYASSAAANEDKKGDGAEMVSIPAGEFWMGSDDGDSDEKPRRRVYLDTFRIDKYEVTNGLYRRFMEATDRARPPYWYKKGFNGSEHPVVGVDWNDANAYCKWAGKRLPTEAEWEKAASGTDGRKYPWGENWDASRANSIERNIGETMPVGSYSRGVSPYGVHDMAGNVWEWVADWYDETYYRRAPDRNPKGSDSGQYRVLRGGSWSNLPWNLRVSFRSRSSPTNRYNLNGFRCAQ